MGGTGSKFALVLATVFVAMGVMSASASGGASIEADPVATAYLPGPYVQDLGEVATFDNVQSPTYHDVTAKQSGPDGRPLFFSKLIPSGQITPVNGTEYLEAGTYGFYCTLHGEAMSGELTVDGSKGTIVARPSIRATLPGQKLKRVRRAGVKVRVKAKTASRGVVVTVKKGKVRLGAKKGISFRAGQVKTFTVKLTRAGRKAVRRGKVVKINVKATVAFGKPSSATRKVR